jgi:hypothetical protein
LKFGKDLLGVHRKACFSMEKKRALSLARRYSASRPLTAVGTSISTHISAASSTLGISFGLRTTLGGRDIDLE